MTTRNGKIATTSSSLNSDQQDTQQVSPWLMCADRLYLLQRDLSEVHDVAETVILGRILRSGRTMGSNVHPASTASFFRFA